MTSTIKYSNTYDIYAGNDGKIYRMDKNGKFVERKPSMGNRGRVMVNCNKVKRPIHVARVVLDAFAGPCPEGCTADHIDRNTANNDITNLRWATLSQQNANRGKWSTKRLSSEKDKEYNRNYRKTSPSWGLSNKLKHIKTELAYVTNPERITTLKERLEQTRVELEIVKRENKSLKSYLKLFVGLALIDNEPVQLSFAF